MKHAALGASSAARWKACPGSVRLINRLPDNERNPSSPYAEEGQCAHALAERVLLATAEEARLGQWINAEGELANYERPGYWEITEEMQEAVDLYVQEVYDQAAGLVCPDITIESMVYPLRERDDMFGTADCIIIESYGVLVVIDFKFGKGHVVEAEWNDQMLYYGVGALNRVGDDASIEKVRLIIVQPRAAHHDGPIRRVEYTVAQLRAEEDEIRAAARATADPNAALIPGEAQCHFCPAAGRCPALGKVALASALSDFEAIEPEIVLPDPNDGPQIARAKKLQGLVRMWADSVDDIAFNSAQRGVEIPGFKLVNGTKHRQWADSFKTAAALAEQQVSLETSHTPPKLKSPAQLEKLMGKAWVAEYAIKLEGAPQLVPDSDRRVAIQPGCLSDFTALTAEKD